MWIPGTWNSELDISRDLATFAEYGPANPDSFERAPQAVLDYRQQMEQNRLKTLNSDIDDNIIVVVSGRGRGIRDRIIRPGEIIESHPQDEIDLKRQIRQVTGLGYSNQLIEQSIEAKTYDPKDTIINPNFRLVPSSHTSSSTSSRNNSPARKNSAASSKKGSYKIKKDSSASS